MRSGSQDPSGGLLTTIFRPVSVTKTRDKHDCIRPYHYHKLHTASSGWCLITHASSHLAEMILSMQQSSPHIWQAGHALMATIPSTAGTAAHCEVQCKRSFDRIKGEGTRIIICTAKRRGISGRNMNKSTREAHLFQSRIQSPPQV